MCIMRLIEFCAGETDSNWNLVYLDTSPGVSVPRPCPNTEATSGGKHYWKGICTARAAAPSGI